MSFKKHSHDRDDDNDEAPISKAVAPVPALAPEEMDANGDPIVDPQAVVTLVVGSAKFNVVGSLRQQIYKITGVSGDTLDVGLSSIKHINVNAPITGYTLAALANGRTRITIASSAPFTGAGIEVLGN